MKCVHDSWFHKSQPGCYSHNNKFVQQDIQFRKMAFKTNTHKEFCPQEHAPGSIFARLVHTGEHSVGACSIIIYYGTHKGVFSSLFNLVPKSLTGLILWSILQA